MIRSPLRAGLALACALSLSACGGGDGEYYLGGAVYGINKGNLVLKNNNNGATVTITQAGEFYFPELVEADSRYDVVVESVPDNIANKEACVVTKGQGRATFNINTIRVNCTINTHKLTGTITGLGSASGLVLVNGDNKVEVPAGATTFAMGNVPEDGKYGITVLQQPAGLNCTVANGVGTMLKADIGNVQVNCASTTTPSA